jgi:hypothetical protein
MVVKSPSFVAQCTLTYSRNTLRAPMRSPGFPPLNFKSWVFAPMQA